MIRFNQGKFGIRDFNLKFKTLASKVNAVYIANLNPPTLVLLKKSPPIPKILQELMERCGNCVSRFLEYKSEEAKSRLPLKMQVYAVIKVFFISNFSVIFFDRYPIV